MVQDFRLGWGGMGYIAPRLAIHADVWKKPTFDNRRGGVNHRLTVTHPKRLLRLDHSPGETVAFLGPSLVTPGNGSPLFTVLFGRPSPGLLPDAVAENLGRKRGRGHGDLEGLRSSYQLPVVDRRQVEVETPRTSLLGLHGPEYRPQALGPPVPSLRYGTVLDRHRYTP